MHYSAHMHGIDLNLLTALDAVSELTYLANRLEQSSGLFRHRPDQAACGGTFRRLADSPSNR